MRNSQLSRLQITGTSQTNENNTEKKDTCPKLNPNFRDISANHGTQCDRIATSQRRIAQNHSCLCIRDATLLLSPEQTLQLSTSQPTLLLVMVRLPTSIIRRLIILLLPDLSFYPPPQSDAPYDAGEVASSERVSWERDLDGQSPVRPKCADTRPPYISAATRPSVVTGKSAAALVNADFNQAPDCSDTTRASARSKKPIRIFGDPLRHAVKPVEEQAFEQSTSAVIPLVNLTSPHKHIELIHQAYSSSFS